MNRHFDPLFQNTCVNFRVIFSQICSEIQTGNESVPFAAEETLSFRVQKQTVLVQKFIVKST